MLYIVPEMHPSNCYTVLMHHKNDGNVSSAPDLWGYILCYVSLPVLFIFSQAFINTWV